MNNQEMKFYLSSLMVFAISHMAFANRFNITCFYDTFSIQRGGIANFTEIDLKTSFEYCSHIVYGYVGLKPGTFDIENLHPRQHQQFIKVRQLKDRYRHIKFLLSLGGDKDLQNPSKYLKLLEGYGHNQENFIRSATAFLRKYKFDGLDLAYQFPHDKVKQHSMVKDVLKKAKNIIARNPVGKKFVDLKHSKNVAGSNQIHMYKQQFTVLINKLGNALRRDKLMLTFTVLPHVNASKYINVPAIIGDLDFVNLGTFDYSTPELTPHEADFLAPLQTPPRHNVKHVLQSNIDNEVRQWLSHHIHAGKVNIGIPAFARSWKMTKELKSSVMPITSSLGGPAQGGELTHTPGLLSWPEFCFKLNKMSKTKNKKYGNYAYRSANVKGDDGLFLTYEDEDSLNEKAEFVKRTSLGGIALFDLTLDDFRGKCKGYKFPVLKTIKFKLF